MAFDAANFARLDSSGNKNLPHLWGYRSSADAQATIVASGYFNSKALELTVGDYIFVHASATKTVLTVQTNNGTTVTTAALVLA